MPSRKSSAELPRPQKRAAQAATVLKKVENIWGKLPKIPSFNGKARFIDAVLMLKTHAHNLAWDLERDAEETEESSPAQKITRTKRTPKTE